MRVSNAILTGNFTTGYLAPMLDPRIGAQHGFGPNMAEWNSNQAYIQQQMICFLIEAPAGFQYLPDPDYHVGAMKALFEVRPLTITGMNAELSATFYDHPVSGGGEMQQDIVDMKRARTVPRFKWVDLYGRPIQSYIYEWMTNLGMDPDTKVPNIATIPGVRPEDLLADMSTATLLFVVPDPMHFEVDKAWLTTNVFPMSTGTYTAKRDLASAKESLELEIEFTGMSQSSLGVRAFARQLLQSLNITNANPHLAPAFVQEIDPNVLAANTGYQAGAENLGASAVVVRE